jgi:hypothetical protein
LWYPAPPGWKNHCILNILPNMYLLVSCNNMERANCVICHLISCPVSLPYFLFTLHYWFCNKSKNNQHDTLVIIVFTILLLIDVAVNCNGPLIVKIWLKQLHISHCWIWHLFLCQHFTETCCLHAHVALVPTITQLTPQKKAIFMIKTMKTSNITFVTVFTGTWTRQIQLPLWHYIFVNTFLHITLSYRHLGLPRALPSSFY